jgi:hypothetical protein
MRSNSLILFSVTVVLLFAVQHYTIAAPEDFTEDALKHGGRPPVATGGIPPATQAVAGSPLYTNPHARTRPATPSRSSSEALGAVRCPYPCPLYLYLRTPSAWWSRPKARVPLPHHVQPPCHPLVVPFHHNIDVVSSYLRQSPPEGERPIKDTG